MSEVHNKTGEVHVHYHIHVDDQLLDILNRLLFYSVSGRNQHNGQLSPTPLQQMDPTMVMNLVEKFVGAISRERDRDDSREERSRYRP
jgi:hypothetical protein